MTSWTFLFIYLFIYFLYFLYYYFWLLFLWLGYEIFAGSLCTCQCCPQVSFDATTWFSSSTLFVLDCSFFLCILLCPSSLSLSLSRNSFMDEAPCLSHAISLVMSCMVMYTMMNTEGVQASYVACGCLAYLLQLWNQ